MSFNELLHASWRKPNWLSIALLPLSAVYWLGYQLDKSLYSFGIKKQYQASVPVIVVGNLTVGGTGKTPFVIYLVEQLRSLGFKPGVISRGYSGSAATYPMLVTPETSVTESGDEPALIVKYTDVPMVIGPNRGADIDLLLANSKCDVIISDDGLQHQALTRDIELCLIDKSTKFTNTFLLPAGPYRESLSRLESVDFVIEHVKLNQFGQSEGRLCMALLASEPQLVKRSVKFDAVKQEMPEEEAADQETDEQGGVVESELKPQLVNAVAGIGNPQRFFNTCKELGFEIIKHAFADHHQFSADDFNFNNRLPILMTEKDAVKCEQFAQDNMWFLPVKAQVSGNLLEKVEKRLQQLSLKQI